MPRSYASHYRYAWHGFGILALYWQGCNTASARLANSSGDYARWRQLGNIACDISATPVISRRDRGVVRSELRTIVVGKDAAAAQQLGEGALLGDRTVAQHDDAVAPLHRRQPVRDNETGAPLHQ